jgi:hypothetical protein
MRRFCRCPDAKLFKRISFLFVQPKIYTVDEHRIAPEKIDSHAFYVIEKLRQAGHKAYLVGGVPFFYFTQRKLLLSRRSSL